MSRLLWPAELWAGSHGQGGAGPADAGPAPVRSQGRRLSPGGASLAARGGRAPPAACWRPAGEQPAARPPRTARLAPPDERRRPRERTGAGLNQVGPAPHLSVRTCPWLGWPEQPTHDRPVAGSSPPGPPRFSSPRDLGPQGTPRSAALVARACSLRARARPARPGRQGRWQVTRPQADSQCGDQARHAELRPS